MLSRIKPKNMIIRWGFKAFVRSHRGFLFVYIKKPAEIISAGPFVFLLENKKAKGEEKPEENLWGSVSFFSEFETTKLRISCLITVLFTSKKNIYMELIIFLRILPSIQNLIHYGRINVE